MQNIRKLVDAGYVSPALVPLTCQIRLGRMHRIVMSKRLYSKKSDPFRNRFLSCTALALYVCALVAMPALDGLLHAHLVAPGLECADPDPNSQLPVPTDTCPICQFMRLAVPFVTVEVPLPIQADVVFDISFSVSIPLVTNVLPLPPCRAPPVCS